MTLLAIDAGNAATSLGFFVNDELVATFSVSSDRRRTHDEWYILIENLLEVADLGAIDELAVCSTVPAILDTLSTCIAKHYTDIPTWVVGPGVKTGIAIHTDNPREVGTDRIVNSVAARDLYGGPAIVVDATGTATVFDVVDAKGNYVGGAIAPGVTASLDALALRSAQLRSVPLAAPARAIGKNTTEAVQSGSVFGFAGLVDGIVTRIISELDADPDDVCVIATGVHMELFAAHCETITDTDQELTLKGLLLVSQRNR